MFVLKFLQCLSFLYLLKYHHIVLVKKKISLSFFFFIMMMTLGWFLYSLIAFKPGSSVLRKLVSKSFSTDIFKFGTILIKNLLNTSAIALSSEIISSDSITFSPSLDTIFFSIKVILDLLCILSVKKGFTFFQKVLLSVMSRIFNSL